MFCSELSKRFLRAGRYTVMNSRWLPKGKVLEDRGIYGHFEFKVLEMVFPGVLFFHHRHCVVSSEFTQDWEHADMPSKYRRLNFHNSAWYKCVTHVNLFRYMFNVIENWKILVFWIISGNAY